MSIHLGTRVLVIWQRALSRSDRGASAVEYGLLLTGIAAVIVVGVYLFGGSVLGLFSSTCGKISAAQSSGSCS